MEPIIKVTADDGRQDPETHYFHSVEQAKRWCEHDAQQVIKWYRAPFNPYVHYSGEIQVGDDMLMYHLEPITITVIEDDGEI